MTNNIKIYTEVEGKLVSNFTMREFQNPIGWVILHEKVPWALEMTRAAINDRYPDSDYIINVTDCTRTQAQLERLAARLGWVDEGGLVARKSYHLDYLGGIAVDFKAYSRAWEKYMLAHELARVASLYFDWVKWYPDGHVHGDFRTLVNF